MKLLIDMNLSPRWVTFLEDAGHEAVHWYAVGAPDAPDQEIMLWARNNGYVVFTHDLDFTALLAATQATSPSVVQLRAQDVLPESLGSIVVKALHQFEQALKEGALISVDPSRARVRVLPFPPS